MVPDKGTRLQLEPHTTLMVSTRGSLAVVVAFADGSSLFQVPIRPIKDEKERVRPVALGEPVLPGRSGCQTAGITRDTHPRAFSFQRTLAAGDGAEGRDQREDALNSRPPPAPEGAAG